MNISQGKSASLLLIYTGGTIGMKQDPASNTLRPFDFSLISQEVPEIRKFTFKVDSFAFDPPIDSSDVRPELWCSLARLIVGKYDEYDGFVVLHGTDTMAYTASALSFMLRGLSKPVVLTGSQLPIGTPRTDGRENIISAVEIASAKDRDGKPMVPEVCVFFDNMLLRGNRTTKVDAEDFRAFRSPNLPPLAEAGIKIRYNRDIVLRGADPSVPPVLHDRLDTSVAVVKIHPGITEPAVRYLLCADEFRAVIIETYGAGNAPAGDWFVDSVREACGKGKIIVNVTQCLRGTVDMDLYANGKALSEAGVISARDSTTESALAKLFVLLGENSDNARVKVLMNDILCGEMS